MRSRMTLACLILAALAIPAFGSAETLVQKVDPWVLEKTAAGKAEFLVMLREQGDLRGAHSLASKEQRGAFVMDSLRSLAQRTQKPLLDMLAARGVEHRAYWIANMIWVRGDRALVEELAARDDVFHVYANPRARFEGPVTSRKAAAQPETPDAVEWGVARVHAPEVWALGYTGQGIVVGGQDTGYDWEHPAIKGKYRGWNGSSANHDYNWHDAVHSGGGSCGADSPEPCDDHSHGTHTMGTMVGSDGSNQIGVAPGAKWIGCRNMDQGAGTPATYSECFEWFIAPTDLGDDNPDPSKAPHVINNSWGCPPSEGCTDPTVLQTVTENTRAAGIEVVVSAGNSGSSCSTVSDPSAIYAASFSVGATSIAANDDIAGFSSRGPVTVDGSGRMKPDISAPGVDVRSSVPGGGYSSFSGTSMAGPHVAGVVALILSATPPFVGDPDAIEGLIKSTAVPRTSSETCGGVPGSEVPNNTYGWGRADALAAFNADLEVTQVDAPDPTLVGVPVTYTITVKNLGTGAALGVTVSEGLTLSATVDSAIPSQGTCNVLAHGASCALGDIPGGGQATVTIVGTPTVEATLTSNATASTSSPELDGTNNAAPVQTSVVACPFAAPTIDAPVSVAAATGGLTATASSGAGHALTWELTGGTITAGQGTDTVTFESGAAGTTMVLALTDTLGACEVDAETVAISVDFSDVSPENIFHDYINTVLRNGVTTGCGTGTYCPNNPVTRAQMAVFLLKAKNGAGHTPPPATGTVFGDVAQGSFGADWIEELASLEITGGCGGGNYCPDAPVTRAQMAVFLLKTLLGSGYVPPAAAGIFGDVPEGSFAEAWIEDIHTREITGGCNAAPLLYCPDNANTRGQMAVFLVKTFDLQ